MGDVLDKLIEAVEAGETPSSRRLRAAWPDLNQGGLNAQRAARGSIDAAMALHEALLPGWSVTLENDDGNIHAAVWPRGEIGEQHGSQGPTLARALLLAILRAYRQHREA